MIATILFNSTLAQPITGTPGVIDGDTLNFGGVKVRLWGIDAPERDQICERSGYVLPWLHTGQRYECGRDAAAVLAELTRGRVVTCTPRDRDRYNRIVAVCSTEAGDLGAAMVRRGWAVDYARYSGGRYRAEEDKARAERLGIWAGWFTMPAEWRRQR